MPAKTLDVTLRARDEATGRFKAMGDSGSSAFGGIASSANLAATAAKVAAAAVAGVAVAAAGVATIATVIGKDFEYAMHKTAAVAGVMDESSAAYKLLAKTAREVGATTAFSATEAANAMYSLVSAGLDAAQAVGATRASVLLAGAAVGSMDQATKMMSVSLKLFNLDASEAAHVADVLTYVTHKSKTDMEGLGLAFTYAAPAASALGMSIEDTAAFLKEFLDRTGEASTAGTAFRSVLSDLAAGMPRFQRRLAAIGITMDEVNPKTHSIQQIIERFAKSTADSNAIMRVFGKETGGIFAKIVEDARKGLVHVDAFGKELKGLSGYAEQAYAFMIDTVEGKWKIFKSTLEELFLLIYDSFKGPLKDMEQVAIEGVGAIIDAFNTIAPVVALIAEVVGQTVTIIWGHLKRWVDGLNITQQDVATWTVRIMQGMQTFVSYFGKALDSIAGTVGAMIVVPFNAIATGVAGVATSVVTAINFMLLPLRAAANALAPYNDTAASAAAALNGLRLAQDKLTVSTISWGKSTVDAVENTVGIFAEHPFENLLNSAFGELDQTAIANAISNAMAEGGEGGAAAVQKVIDEIKAKAQAALEAGAGTGGGRGGRGGNEAQKLIEQRTRDNQDALTQMQEQRDKELKIVDQAGKDRAEVEKYWDDKIAKEKDKQAKHDKAQRDKEKQQKIGAMEDVGDAFGKINEATGQKSLELFRMQQAVSIATSTMKAYEAATAAFAEVPYPWNYAASAAILAAALANVAIIAQQEPAMAEGGIVTRPTRALIGEAGPEAVIPLSRGGFGTTQLIINVNGPILGKRREADKLARWLGPATDRYNRRRDVSS